MVGTSSDIDRIVFLAGAGIFAVITIQFLKTLRRVMTTAKKLEAADKLSVASAHELEADEAHSKISEMETHNER